MSILIYNEVLLVLSIYDGGGTSYELHGNRDPDDCGVLTGKVMKGGLAIGSFRIEQV